MAATRLGTANQISSQPTEDMNETGNREEMHAEYSVGFNDDGLITALDMKMLVDGGYGYDSVLLSHFATKDADNVYNIANLRYDGQALQTNRVGTIHLCVLLFTPNGVLHRMCDGSCSREAGLDPAVVRRENLQTGDTLPNPIPLKLKNCNIQRCWDSVKKKVNYDQLVADVKEFNEKNRWRKRGFLGTR